MTRITRMLGILPAASAALLLTGGAAEALTPLQKCQADKLKFSGKYSLCRMLAEAKAVRTGNAPDYTVCNQKIGTWWAKVEGRPGAVCTVPGDLAPIQNRVTTDANELTQAIGGNTVADCGNAVLEPGEDCEFGDLDGETCVTQGFAGGTLGCSACALDTSACYAARFVDNADGTITDNQTGLEWEKKVGLDFGGLNYANLNEADNYFRWSGSCTIGGARCQPSAAASAACGTDLGCAECGVGEGTCNTGGVQTIWEFIVALNAASFAGHTDWRVPTRDELLTIVTYDLLTNPAVDPALHAAATCGAACTDVTDPTCSCTQSSLYWSASSYVPLPSYAWVVYFSDGQSYVNGKSTYYYVRAVRGGS